MYFKECESVLDLKFEIGYLQKYICCMIKLLKGKEKAIPPGVSFPTTQNVSTFMKMKNHL